MKTRKKASFCKIQHIFINALSTIKNANSKEKDDVPLISNLEASLVFNSDILIEYEEENEHDLEVQKYDEISVILIKSRYFVDYNYRVRHFRRLRKEPNIVTHLRRKREYSKARVQYMKLSATNLT